MRFTLLSAPFLLCATTFASSYVFDLPQDSAAIAGLDFYIDGVRDVREDRSSVGTARTGFFNRSATAELAAPLPEELSRYFARVAPKGDRKRAFSVEVEEFHVEEELGYPTESATARVRLAFKATDGRVVTASGQARRSSGWDATQFHASNLAACVNICLRNLSQLDTVPSARPNSLQGLRRDSSARVPTAPPPAAFEPSSPRSVVLVGWIPGWNANSIGIQWLKYDDLSDHWIFPTMGSLEIPVIRKAGIQSAGFLEFTPGIAALRRISSGSASALLQIGVPMGYESFKRTNGESESGFFLGLNSSQCIALIPVGEAGLALDAGPFESVLFGSKFYPWDLGFRIAVGWQL